MKIILPLLALFIKSALSANILVVAPLPSPSHYIWNSALAYGLVNKNHNVTVVTSDKDDSPRPKNLHHILLEGTYEFMHENEEMNINEMFGSNPIHTLIEMQSMPDFFCEIFLKPKSFQNLLDYPKDFKFDLIIIDVTMGSCFYPLIHRFHYPPTIAVTPFLLPSYVAYNFGNQVNPSYLPWHSLPYTGEMTFMERVSNFLLVYVEVGLRYVHQYRQEHKVARKYFGEDIPSMVELERHMSLILTNSDPVLDFPQPLAPNFIPVGGLHTRKAKKLPDDLQNLVDGAKNGVIVFSLGTNIRSDKLDENVQQVLLSAFSKIPETIVWKFESEIKDLPKNVIVRKWLPQNDLLGHPNVKLFIGHGGALSTQEAIFHGVPMICVPFLMDQFLNTQNVVTKKMGLELNIRNATSEDVYRTIREVLNNPIYSENMKKSSNRFKDRMETPLERGVFWAEYVIRHGGAHFLNTPARDLPLYKASGLDVLVFISLVVVLFFIVVLKIVKLLKKLRRKKKVKTN
ncbi:UDP-glucosyltransferase 2-like [Zophobas morio]|uniref:UDP-glucosyltransferase 2-like n=1 Tax=Zophobas morio TaxID=2755281 RepID=UPI0030839760